MQTFIFRIIVTPYIRSCIIYIICSIYAPIIYIAYHILGTAHIGRCCISCIYYMGLHSQYSLFSVQGVYISCLVYAAGIQLIDCKKIINPLVGPFRVFKVRAQCQQCLRKHIIRIIEFMYLFAAIVLQVPERRL